MTGLSFNFDTQDIEILDGRFRMSSIDNQNAALIALSQVCRLTKPEVGAQIGTFLANRQKRDTKAILSAAERMIRSDGGEQPSVRFIDGILTFTAYYGY